MKGEWECEDEVMKCEQEDELVGGEEGFEKWSCGIGKDGGFMSAISVGEVGEIDGD